MANRLILTLLALLTGLVVQVGPVDARVVGIESVQVRLYAEVEASKAARIPVALAKLPSAGFRNTRQVAVAAPMRRTLAPVPAVLSGIDRARE